MSSSLLSAALTAIANWIFHRSNYRREYYQKILDKRLSSYEIINSLISRLSIQIQFDHFLVPHIVSSQQYYDQFIVDLARTIECSFWLNTRLSLKLTELNVFLLNNIGNKINEKEKAIDAQFIALGKENREKLHEFKKDLEKLISEDLKSLHNLKSFFKNSTKHKELNFNIYKKDKI